MAITMISGPTKKPVTKYTATCGVCGAVYEADKSDLRIIHDRNEKYFSSEDCQTPGCTGRLWFKPKEVSHLSINQAR